MDFNDIKQFIGWVVAGLIGLVMWFSRREIKRIDDRSADHEMRIRMTEEALKDIMKRPDVLALYQEQKEESREKFRDLKQDHLLLRQDLTSRIESQDKKLDKILDRIENRSHNERSGDTIQ